jgi:hypothetical protein
MKRWRRAKRHATGPPRSPRFPQPSQIRVAHDEVYFANEIDSTWIVCLFIPPVTATSYPDFLPVLRTSSAAFAFPPESNSKALAIGRHNSERLRL